MKRSQIHVSLVLKNDYIKFIKTNFYDAKN